MAKDELADLFPRRGVFAGVLPVVVLAALFATLSLTGVVLVPANTQDVVILRGSGVAIGALLVFGRGLWPGVFLGALTSQAILAATGLSGSLAAGGVLVALALAAALTLQALAGASLIRHVCGFPLRLQGWRDLSLVVYGVVPLVCLIAPTCGIGLFALSHPAVPADLPRHWGVWWVGDLISVWLAVPVAVLGPWNKTPAIYWRGHAAPRFTGQAIVYLALSVAVTFLSWIQVSHLGNRSDEVQFETLVRNTEQALKHRLEVYSLALGGGAGLFRASDRVTAQDWRDYVESLNLSGSLLGLDGMGFIEPVTAEGLAEFLQSAGSDGMDTLSIQPEITRDPMFVIKYIEPKTANQTALGLNIAFEKNRFEAAIRARDTGATTITAPIVLVQYKTHGPGFLILVPVYSGNTLPQTVTARQDTFVGWVYSPIIAARLLGALTPSQDENLHVSAYSGTTADAQPPFYSSAPAPTEKPHPPRFRKVDTLEIFGKPWTIVWESSAAFEASLWSLEPAGVLIGGLSFSVLLGTFLMSLIHREDLVRATVALRTKELAAQVEENRSIIETVVAMIALLDENGTILRTNDALPRLFVCDAQDIIGKPFADLLRGALTEYFSQPDIKEARRPYRGELETTSSRGQSLTLDVHIIPWKNGDGDWRYTAVMRNITEHRRVADQLRQTQHRLDLALTGAKIGVFDIDLHTGKSIVSRTWRELLGYDDDEDIDAQNNWLQRIHPDDLPIVQAADLACIEGRASRSVSEYRIRMNDESWHWMRSDAVGEERDAEGRAWRLIGLQSDVTDQRQVDELKKQFVSTVSHELRTPLTSINGSLSLLLNAMSGGISEPARRMLSIAQKNCDRLIRLVNDILDLEKLESGPSKPTLSPADLSVQVRRAITVNQPFATRFGVIYDISHDAPGTMVMLEENRFQQVMSNLLSNAAKFSPKGATVSIAIDRTETQVKVSVTDSGPGIPKEFHDRIFKAFSQVDGSSSRQTEGTGLGLHIAKKTIEQMHGAIGFDSDPGVATTFWVTLPVHSQESMVAEGAVADALISEPALIIPRILHVEDDSDFSEVLAAAFGQDAVVLNATSEIAARNRLSHDKFDMIILDWELGDGDGAALLADIALCQPKAPVVVLTSAEHRPRNPQAQLTFIKSRVHLSDVARQCLGLLAPAPAAARVTATDSSV